MKFSRTNAPQAKLAENGEEFFIGWDVGGWNCDKNGRSRDAIVILNSQRAIVGTPQRTNLRERIAKSNTTTEWLGQLFELCDAGFPSGAIVTMAIDTPLGFSDAFVALITRKGFVEADAQSARNSYLFRKTERELDMTPLSAVKDRIGSQATKGMHALAKFASRNPRCGVWTNGHGFTAIETYPAACKNSSALKKLRGHGKSLDHADKDDALTCALIAYLFATDRDALRAPERVPKNEGWIWAPKK